MDARERFEASAVRHRSTSDLVEGLDTLVRALILEAGGEVTLSAAAMVTAGQSVLKWHDTADGSRVYTVVRLPPR